MGSQKGLLDCSKESCGGGGPTFMRYVTLMRTRCSVWALPSRYAKPSTVFPRDTAACRRAPWSFCAATCVAGFSTRATDVLRAPCLSRGPCLWHRLASTITGTIPVMYLLDSLWVPCRPWVCTESFIHLYSQNKPVSPNRFGRWQWHNQGLIYAQCYDCLN